MASQAKTHGVATVETTGHIPYPIHQDVHFTTRMHLNQEQAATLIVDLQRFVNTGSI